MTSIDKIRALNDPIITPALAAEALRCDPRYIRIAAREKPELLGFPVSVMGNRVRIPRIPFLKFLEGE